MLRWLTLAVCLGLCAAPASADDKPPADREYRQGPLTKDDFRAKADPQSPYLARTETDYRYRYAYRYSVQRGETIVTLTEIELWAILKADESWNRRPDDEALLDHEQGHFDITQLAALEAQAVIQQRIDKGPKVQVKAITQTEAVKRLEDQIKALVKPYVEDSLAAQREYDKATAHGTDAAAQADARRDHQRRLSAFAAPVEAPRP